jgi:hypothetical protein
LQAGSLLLGVAGRLWRFGATAVLGVGLRCPLHDHIRAGRETLAQREDLALDLGNRHLAARGARFEFSHGRLVLARWTAGGAGLVGFLAHGSGTDSGGAW